MNLTEMLGGLFAIVFILVSYLLPYFHLRRWKVLSSIEAADLSVGASSLFFGAIAFATHAAGIDQRLCHVRPIDDNAPGTHLFGRTPDREIFTGNPYLLRKLSHNMAPPSYHQMWLGLDG